MMEDFSYWFLLALVLLGLEMATGTFYLLVLAIAAAAAGIAAILSVGIVGQLMFCVLSVISGTVILRRWKKTQVRVAVDNNLDVGQQVAVVTWHENGSLRVAYRGAEWDAVPESADMPRDGIFFIKEMRGSTLVLSHRKPQHH